MSLLVVLFGGRKHRIITSLTPVEQMLHFAIMFCLALALLLPVRTSAEFSCPVFEPAAVSEGDARYASKPVVDCAFKFIGGKAAGTPHVARLT